MNPNPVRTESDGERTAFEAAYADLSPRHARDGRGGYFNAVLHIAWAAWLKRADISPSFPGR